AKDRHERDDHRRMQQDARSLRAVACLPGLCALLADDDREDVRQARSLLCDWNGDWLPELGAPAVFNVFFVEWCQRVAFERFAGDAVPLLSGGIEGLAAKLLADDSPDGDADGWFGRRLSPIVCKTFRGTLDRLRERFGPTMSEWTWGRLHR